MKKWFECLWYRITCQSWKCDIIEQMKGCPPSLTKAFYDHFEYVLKLRSGEIIYFSDARKLRDGWIELTLSTMRDTYRGKVVESSLPFPAERGIDVRLSEILWCADAPFGS